MNTTESTKPSSPAQPFTGTSPTGDLIDAFSLATKSLKKAGLKLDNLGQVTVTISVMSAKLGGVDDTPAPHGVKDLPAAVTNPSSTTQPFTGSSPTGDLIEAFSLATKSLRKSGRGIDNLGQVTVTISMISARRAGMDDTPGRGVKDLPGVITTPGKKPGS